MKNHGFKACWPAALLVIGSLLVFACGTEKEYASSIVSTYDRAKATGTEADMKAIGAALSSYQLDNDDYPSVSGIEALGRELKPDYIRMIPARDKWGHPFEYSSSSLGYKLVSIGHDGIKGTEDDMVFEDGRLTQKPPEH
jgi:hypothetical protein